jgi:hypothetical protein
MAQKSAKPCRSAAVRSAGLILRTIGNSGAPKLKDFASVHGTPAQRLFNLLCLAYGSDPKTFAGIREMDLLPKDRADGCEGEYRQVDHAIRKLIPLSAVTFDHAGAK